MFNHILISRRTTNERNFKTFWHMKDETYFIGYIYRKKFYSKIHYRLYQKLMYNVFKYSYFFQVLFPIV